MPKVPGRKFLMLVTICLQSSCASMVNGSHQDLTVETVNDTASSKTECVIKNEEGTWNARSNSTVSIHRDGNSMEIQCSNELQTGMNSIEPKFNGGLLAADFIYLDLCIISCVIDGVTNAFYEYPSGVTVPMVDKKPK